MAGEEEDDGSEDGSGAIDVRCSTSPVFVFLCFFFFFSKQATVDAVTQLFPVRSSDEDRKKKKRKSAIKEETKPKDEDEPLPIDMLADTIIGFLEKGTAFLRTVANQSFSLLTARLEKSTIELILTVRIMPRCNTIFLG